MPYDASNRKQVRAAEKEAERQEIGRIDFLKSMMSNVHGRLWFYDLLESCHLFNDPFTGNPYQEAFLKGERNVGLRIFADIVAHCPDQYISMVKDANGRRQSFNAALNPDIYYDSNGHPTPGERPIGTDPGWDPQGPVDAFLEPTVGDA